MKLHCSGPTKLGSQRDAAVGNDSEHGRTDYPFETATWQHPETRRDPIQLVTYKGSVELETHSYISIMISGWSALAANQAALASIIPCPSRPSHRGPLSIRAVRFTMSLSSEGEITSAPQ